MTFIPQEIPSSHVNRCGNSAIYLSILTKTVYHLYMYIPMYRFSITENFVLYKKKPVIFFINSLSP